MPSRQTSINLGTLERVATIAAGSLLLWRGLTRRSPLSLTGAIAGAGLMYRGVSGYCPLYDKLGAGKPAAAETEARQFITINKPAAELHQLWKAPENFSRLHAHVADVAMLSDKLSHWKLRTPLGHTFEWDAEIYEEIEGKVLRWRSLPGAALDNAGELHFQPAPAGLGTEVMLDFRFTPPGGPVVQAVSRALSSLPRAVVGTTLRKFKALAETGEIPTLHANPSGRGGAEQGATLAPAETSVAA